MLFWPFKQAQASQELHSSLLCAFSESYLVPHGVGLGLCALVESMAEAIHSRPCGDTEV